MKLGFLRTMALAGSVLLLGATPPKLGLAWNNTVTLTADGERVLGNPAAKVRLTEFISYTCPHCAAFDAEADAPLRLGYVPTGKVAIEVHQYLRNPIDLTVAMLVDCVPKEKFFLLHTAFLRGQSRWIAPLEDASEAQRRRWTTGSLLERNRAIASDFGFYQIMESRGYDRIATERCLADEALAHRLAERTEAAAKLGVTGTPGFMINGLLLVGTWEWNLLRPQLDAWM